MRDDLLEDVAHLERVAVLLIDEDVAAGERRLVEMPDQRLLLQRQRREAVRVELHDRRIVDALEQVLAVGGAPVPRVAAGRGAAADDG